VKREAVCAERPKNERALTAASLLFFGGMALLALWLLATGDPVEKTAGALALALGLLLALCTGHRLLNPPPERYCLEDGLLRFGGASLALSAVRTAKIERRPVCPFLKHTLTELALVLEANTGARLAFPLTYENWERVHEAIRARRPELGLAPWEEDPLVLEALLRARGAVRRPQNVRLVRENFYLGVFAAFLVVLLLPLVLLPLPRWIQDNAALFAPPLAFLAYHRVVRKRLLVETDRGARETP